MKETITAVLGGLITYIVSQELIGSMVTGTTTGDTLIQDIVPIVLAVAVVMIVIKRME